MNRWRQTLSAFEPHKCVGSKAFVKHDPQDRLVLGAATRSLPHVSGRPSSDRSVDHALALWVTTKGAKEASAMNCSTAAPHVEE